MRNNPYHFRNKKEFNAAVNKKIKPLINAEIEKYHKNLEQAKIDATNEALVLLLPIVCTSLYEAFGFAEVRQDKFLDYFSIHMQCIEDGVTSLDQYQQWCQDNNVRYFKCIEVEKE